MSTSYVCSSYYELHLKGGRRKSLAVKLRWDGMAWFGRTFKIKKWVLPEFVALLCPY